MAPCKVLLVGATGYLGKYVAFACARLGHETFAIVRSTTPSDPAKAELLSKFQDAGITLLVGDIKDKAALVPALKRVNVVISTVSMVPDQITLIEAAQEAGTIKRFLPSEFGNDVDRQGINDLDILKPIFGSKQQVRRALEKSGIPFTFVCSGSFAGHYLKPIVQDAKSPPRDGKLVVLGDGNAKAIFTDEDDIGTFTAKCLDDPRAENKSLHIRPKGNIASTNEVIALWEKKLGHTFEKEFMDDAQVAKSVESLPFPANFLRAIKHAVFVNGDQCAFDLDPAKDVEATELYPDVKYITIDEYLSRLV